jgi:hypothetical protein
MIYEYLLLSYHSKQRFITFPPSALLFLQDKAHALLTRAAAEFPLDVSVGTELAKLEERRGHLEEARALLERYSKLKECDANPRHGGALYNT